jgi:hypothetical protein
MITDAMVISDRTVGIASVITTGVINFGSKKSHVLFAEPEVV